MKGKSTGFLAIFIAAYIEISCISIYKTGKPTQEELKSIEPTSLKCSYFISAKVELYYRAKGLDHRAEDKPKEYEQKLELIEDFKADLISKHKIPENRILTKYEDFVKVKGCRIDVFIEKRIVDTYFEQGLYKDLLPGGYMVEFIINAILESRTPKCLIEYTSETRFLNMYHFLTLFTFFLFQDFYYQEKIISYHDKLMHRDFEVKVKQGCGSG
ncbi:hypothetical protein EHQ81_12665 [Leptospira selangorensis]|uniref:Uncharacterized protein n=1 Tax=Leptospira selangorensis TaxID=2484982 RepID=A0A5F2C6P8_9LEPT|nr:hypothetical protein [Leptospira selangorensis]TGM12738.1 hypothetical protein EHQ81_12665 [Leptospira selangorensis]TGM30799.1 hypothetical protein EHQ82_00505 [Leptospira selangorensis]